MKFSKYNIIKEYEGNTLLYNSFTKSSIILDENIDLKKFEKDSEIDKFSEYEKKLLIDNGFIIDDNRDETNELKYIFHQKYFDNSFFNIVLVPTLKCNFACPYCFEKGHSCGKENIKKYFETLYKYAEKYFKLHNVVQISLFGGEPLLYIKEALEFLEWVKNDSVKNNYEYFVSIVTNGSLLNEEIFNKLLEHNLYSLQITIDSDMETHDNNRIFKNGKPSFMLLIDNINTLLPLTKKYEKFKFVLRINLNNTTVEKVQKSLDYIKQDIRSSIYLLIRAVYNTKTYQKNNNNSLNELKPYFDLGKQMEFKIITEKYNYQTCEACGDNKIFYLMPDLSIWKCINDLDFKQSCFGKILDNGEVDLIPENMVNWYEKCSETFKDEECLKCKKLPDCLGGCPLYKAKHQQKSCRSFDMVCLPYLIEE